VPNLRPADIPQFEMLEADTSQIIAEKMTAP
jgi:hypothetical protein